MADAKPIHARSKHHVGDMYVHNKHKFVVKIVGRGEWYGKRACEVVKGDVPEIVRQRVNRLYTGYSDVDNMVLEYSTCALTTCFTRLKAGQVLFG